MNLRSLLSVLLALSPLLSPVSVASTAVTAVTAAPSAGPKHTFTIGEEQFLLDGRKLVIRCGEMHFARIPWNTGTIASRWPRTSA